MSLDEYFSTGPEHERPIFEAVIGHLDGVGPVHVEPLSVGIFLKRAQTFAQIRPRDRWVALSFGLARKVDHDRIVRKVVLYGAKYHHVANLRSPEDLDNRLRAWLTEAYLVSPT